MARLLLPASSSTTTTTTTTTPLRASLALLLVVVLLLADAAAAWRLSINYSDGSQFNKHGHHNSGCRSFRKSDAKITSAFFEQSLSADTFVLYHDHHCKDEGFRGRKGNQPVPIGKYGSWKVY